MAQREQRRPPNIPEKARNIDLSEYGLENRYEDPRILGAGGMGEVFLITTVAEPKTDHVLKRLHRSTIYKDSNALERFKREAEALKKLNGDGVPRLIESGEEPGKEYYIMERVPGGQLTKIAPKDMAAKRAVQIICRASRIMQAAHKIGLIHRDLKPDNIMIAPRQDMPDLVNIVDFGQQLDKTSMQPRLTAHGTVHGTTSYMAPEQAAGVREVDERIDVFALGNILYELLSGVKLYTITDLVVFHTTMITKQRDVQSGKKNIRVDYKPLEEIRDDLPEKLLKLIDKMLSFTPGDRPNMEEVTTELAFLLAKNTLPETISLKTKSKLNTFRSEDTKLKVVLSPIPKQDALIAELETGEADLLEIDEDSNPDGIVGAIEDNQKTIATPTENNVDDPDDAIPRPFVEPLKKRFSIANEPTARAASKKNQK